MCWCLSKWWNGRIDFYTHKIIFIIYKKKCKYFKSSSKDFLRRCFSYTKWNYLRFLSTGYGYQIAYNRYQQKLIFTIRNLKNLNKDEYIVNANIVNTNAFRCINFLFNVSVLYLLTIYLFLRLNSLMYYAVVLLYIQRWFQVQIIE